MRKVPIETIFESEESEGLGMPFMNKERIQNDLRDRVLFKSAENLGVMLPLVLTPNASGGFSVIDGYRRLLACKKANVKVPFIIKNTYDPDDAVVMRIALNFSQKSMDYQETSKLMNEVKKPSKLREIGFTTQEIFAFKNAPKDILRELEYRPPEVTIEVAKTSLIDKGKAKELITLVKREDAKTKEEVKKLKDQVNEVKSGVSCALCGVHLSEEKRNWMAVCSSCKWILLEEFKETVFDKKIRDWLTGHYVYADEVVVVSKKALFDLINNVPDDVRINSGLQKVWERLNHELGMESVEQGEQVSQAVAVRG